MKKEIVLFLSEICCQQQQRQKQAESLAKVPSYREQNEWRGNKQGGRLLFLFTQETILLFQSQESVLSRDLKRSKCTSFTIFRQID